MRSDVIVKGGSSHTKLALATREFFLVGKRMEGLYIDYMYRRREKALIMRVIMFNV
jgi:hypothetical protein